MSKSIWKALVLFLTLAALCQQASATPIITQLTRSVFAQGFLDGVTPAETIPPVGDTDFGTSLGLVDLSADALNSRGCGIPGCTGVDFIHAHVSQHSTVDVFGFSY